MEFKVYMMIIKKRLREADKKDHCHPGVEGRGADQKKRSKLSISFGLQ